MMNLNLNITPQTARKLKKVLDQAQSEESFAQNVIAYQVSELKRAALNLRLDLKALEEKYNMPSSLFYKRYRQGKMGDDEDYMRWAGLIEMLENNEKRLRGLEG